MKKIICLSLAMALCMIILNPSVLAGSVSRDVEKNILLGRNDLNVDLNVMIDEENYYLIDESYPENWIVIDDGGLSTAEAGHLKAVVLTGATSTTYTYTIQPSQDLDSGNYGFSGTYSMEGIESTNISGDENVKYVKDHGTYYLSNNTCETINNNFKITTENCHAQDVDGKDITQYVTFEWLGGTELDTSWVFAYTDNLTSGSLYYKQNISYEDHIPELINKTANITVHNVQSIEVIGNPSEELCDIGNEWNSIARNVTQLINGTELISTVYCFNQFGQFNETAYWLRGTYDGYQYTTVMNSKYVWTDITNEVSYNGYNLLGNNWNYYNIKDATFDPDEKIETKWVFTPKDATKDGEWHILGYKSGQTVSSAIQNDEYIYQDPFWNSSWSRRMPIDINTSEPISKIQYKLNIPYDSDMKADYSDLRFLSNCSEDAVELYSANDTQSVDSISVWINLFYYTTNLTICMYYGNPSAEAYWDWNNTIMYYQDFENVPNGNLGVQDGWYEVVTTGNDFTVTDSVGYNSGKSVYIITSTGTTSIDRNIQPDSQASKYFEFRGKQIGNEVASVGYRLWEITNFATSNIYFKDTGTDDGIYASIVTGQKLAENNEDTWYKLNGTWINSTDWDACLENSTDTICYSGRLYDGTRTGFANRMRLDSGNTGGTPNGTTWFDDIKLINMTKDFTYTLGAEEEIEITLSVITISVQSPIDPVENSVIQVESFANATGENFDTGLCYLYYPNGTLKTQNLAVENAVNASFTELNCTFDMAYYDVNGTYNITVVVNDTLANTAQLDTTFLYNSLNAFTLNTSSLSFGTLVVGQSETSIFTMTNYGNINLDLQINGSNLTSGSGDIDVSYIKFDDDSDLSDGTNMTTSLQSFITLNVLDSDILGYIQLTIPLETLADSYTGTITLES